MHPIYLTSGQGIPFDGQFYQPGYSNKITQNTIFRSTPDSFFSDIANRSAFTEWNDAIISKNPSEFRSDVDIFNFITQQSFYFLQNVPGEVFEVVYWDGVADLGLENYMYQFIRIFKSICQLLEFEIYYDQEIVQGLKITNWNKNNMQISPHLLVGFQKEFQNLIQKDIKAAVLLINQELKPKKFASQQLIILLNEDIDPDNLLPGSVILGRKQISIDLAVYLAVNQRQKEQEIRDENDKILTQLELNQMEIQTQITLIDEKREMFDAKKKSENKEVYKFLKLVMDM